MQRKGKASKIWQGWNSEYLVHETFRDKRRNFMLFWAQSEGRYRETLRVGDLFGQIRLGGRLAPTSSDLPKQINSAENIYPLLSVEVFTI